MRGAVVCDARGKIERVSGSCWDITEQWNATAELARTSSLLRATLEATADGLLVVDREGKVARRFRSKVTPQDPDVVGAIEKLL
jgi:PAS domain-containing protein